MRAITAKPVVPRTVAIAVYDGVAMFEFAIANEIFGSTHVAGYDGPWYRFLNVGNLRRHFTRSLHTTPSAYRHTFATRQGY